MKQWSSQILAKNVSQHQQILHSSYFARKYDCRKLFTVATCIYLHRTPVKSSPSFAANSHVHFQILCRRIYVALPFRPSSLLNLNVPQMSNQQRHQSSTFISRPRSHCDCSGRTYVETLIHLSGMFSFAK